MSEPGLLMGEPVSEPPGRYSIFTSRSFQKTQTNIWKWLSFHSLRGSTKARRTDNVPGGIWSQRRVGIGLAGPRGSAWHPLCFKGPGKHQPSGGQPLTPSEVSPSSEPRLPTFHLLPELSVYDFLFPAGLGNPWEEEIPKDSASNPDPTLTGYVTWDPSPPLFLQFTSSSPFAQPQAGDLEQPEHPTGKL